MYECSTRKDVRLGFNRGGIYDICGSPQITKRLPATLCNEQVLLLSQALGNKNGKANRKFAFREYVLFLHKCSLKTTLVAKG